mmetsp:Transcript_83162/g.262745  ORF Transcript_83162/g.262745 Transcript_83162/m.262745 type:complete len:215 (+) Transcript_83162:187-831(+)
MRLGAALSPQPELCEQDQHKCRPDTFGHVEPNFVLATGACNGDSGNSKDEALGEDKDPQCVREAHGGGHHPAGPDDRGQTDHREDPEPHAHGADEEQGADGEEAHLLREDGQWRHGAVRPEPQRPWLRHGAGTSDVLETPGHLPAGDAASEIDQHPQAHKRQHAQEHGLLLLPRHAEGEGGHGPHEEPGEEDPMTGDVAQDVPQQDAQTDVVIR